MNDRGLRPPTGCSFPHFDTNPNLSTVGCSAETTTYGCWTAKALGGRTPDSRVAARHSTRQATTHDFAFAVVGDGGRARGCLDAVVGPYPVDRRHEHASGRGEHAECLRIPGAGHVQRARTSPTARIRSSTDRLQRQDLTWGLACDMTGGSSGGPWLDGQPDLRLNLAAGTAAHRLTELLRLLGRPVHVRARSSTRRPQPCYGGQGSGSVGTSRNRLVGSGRRLGALDTNCPTSASRKAIRPARTAEAGVGGSV